MYFSLRSISTGSTVICLPVEIYCVRLEFFVFRIYISVFADLGIILLVFFLFAVFLPLWGNFEFLHSSAI